MYATAAADDADGFLIASPRLVDGLAKSVGNVVPSELADSDPHLVGPDPETRSSRS